MTPGPYDFRNPTPLPGDLSRRLDLWFGEAARRVPKSWPKVLNIGAELRPKGHELVAPDDCPAYIPEEAVCFRVALGPGGAASLLVMPRTLMLVLLGGALGEAIARLPVERVLTAVEEALCEYLVRALLLDVLRECWSGAGPLRIELQRREPDPRGARLFPPGEGVLVGTFSIVGAFGEIDWCWLLPRSGWLEGLSLEAIRALTETKAADTQMEALARLLPVELVVHLGSAEVTLTEVERLQPGDVIVLDQRVSAPLAALISGAEKFRVLPGASGTRHAVRIESVVAV
jgi:flagellar motor switch protein FliM